MAENYVSSFEVITEGVPTEAVIKDSGARSLVAQEIADRSELIKKDKNENTVIESVKNIVETGANKYVHVTGTNSLQVDGNTTETFTGSYNATYKSPATVQAEDLALKIQNGLTYGSIAPHNGYKSVKLKDEEGNDYYLPTTDNKFTPEPPHYIIIGDSYATRTATNWITELKMLLGEDQCLSNAKDGAGFTNGDFLDLLNTFENDPLVTKIIVGGCINDITYVTPSNLYDPTSFFNAVTTFRNKAIEKFPSADIYIAHIGNVKPSFLWTTYKNNSASRWFLNYAIQQLPTISNVILLNGLQYSNLNFDNLVDQTHPTEDYSKKLGHYIYNALITGSVEMSLVQNGTLKIVAETHQFELPVFFINNALLIVGGTASGPFTSVNNVFSLGTIEESGVAVPFLNYSAYLEVSFDSETIWTHFNVFWNEGKYSVTLTPTTAVSSATSITINGTIYNGDPMNW